MKSDMVNTKLEHLLRENGVLHGTDDEARQPASRTLTTNTALNVVASVLTIAAAIIAVFGRVPPWASGGLVALVVVSVTLLLGQHAAGPARRVFTGIRRKRAARRLVVAALELSSRVKGQMDLQRMDSLPGVLHGFGRNGLYGEPAPNMFWISRTYDEVVTLLHDARGRRADPVLALTLLDRILAAFHENHIKVIGDHAAKLKDKLNDYQISELRKARSRYEMLIEDYRKVAEVAERDLGLSIGMWCYNMPAVV
jgi:hypothetical protein